MTNIYLRYLNGFYYEVNPETGLTIGHKGITQSQVDIYRKMSNLKVYIV